MICESDRMVSRQRLHDVTVEIREQSRDLSTVTKFEVIFGGLFRTLSMGNGSCNATFSMLRVTTPATSCGCMVSNGLASITVGCSLYRLITDG